MGYCKKKFYDYINLIYEKMSYIDIYYIIVLNRIEIHTELNECN